MAAALKFTDVRKRFGAVEALRGLDMEVPTGSIFGLIGPNGAGKTTAFSIACGFLKPDSGEVSLLGGGGFDPVRLKGRVTAMPQDATLGRETRCLDHLLYFARLQGISAAEAPAQALRVLGEVGLGDRAKARTKTLSHGMLRRLATAQALLGKPELVLLDEPTSGLDPRHAHELREVLRKAREGRTLIISSHNLPELETLCDHVVFIDQGRNLAGGAVDVITGRGQEIEILLGAGPQPVEAVRAVLPAAQISWTEGTRSLRIVVATPGESDPTAEALRALLDGGARIVGLRQGQSLEKKFLEMT